MNNNRAKRSTQAWSRINEDIILIHQDSMDSMNFNSCNSYLIKIEDNNYAIIDPGCSRKKFNKTLKDNHINISQIKYFYLTHGHSDHVVLLDYLREKNENVEGFIHLADKEYVENPFKYYKMLFDLTLLKRKTNYEDFLTAINFYAGLNTNVLVKPGFKMIFDIWNIKPRKVEHVFKDGDKLVGDLEVIHAPGHTPGMCFFYREKDKILFSSDIHLSTVGASVSGAAGNFHDLKQSIEKAIKMVQDKKVKIVLSGHGKNPISVNLKERLVKFYDSINQKEEQILNLLNEKKEMTLDEITEETFKIYIKRFKKYLDNESVKDTIVIAEISEMMHDLNILKELNRMEKVYSFQSNGEIIWKRI